jgi:hypothetical protein
LHILRGEQQSEMSFALGGSSASVFVLSEDPQSSAKARAIREGILHGKTDAPYAPAKAASAKPEIIVPTSAAARNAADSASQAVFATASGEK